jgi:hypothetical protein
MLVLLKANTTSGLRFAVVAPIRCEFGGSIIVAPTWLVLDVSEAWAPQKLHYMHVSCAWAPWPTIFGGGGACDGLLRAGIPIRAAMCTTYPPLEDVGGSRSSTHLSLSAVFVPWSMHGGLLERRRQPRGWRDWRLGCFLCGGFVPASAARPLNQWGCGT